MTSISHAALRAFHAVAAAGSFTEAAARLNVTQPTLSGQVKALEAQFGLSLFDRRRRRIELTETGRNLLEITWRLFGLEAEAEHLLTAAKGLQRGHLRLGADAPHHAVPYLAAFSRLYPKVRLSMATGNAEAIRAGLIEQRFDVGIVAGHIGDKRLLALPITEDRLIAFVDRAHPWAGRRQIALADLAGKRLILREPGSTTRRIFESALRDGGVKPSEVLEIASREAIREAVAAGLGIGIVARSELGDDRRLKALEFAGPPLTSIEYAACRADKNDTPLVKAFLAIVRETVR